MSLPAFPQPKPLSVIELVTEARSLLAQATTISEVKVVRDQAQALRDYVKQQGECLEIQNAAAEIKIRAERRAGQILSETERSEGGRPSQNLSHDATGFAATLPELGINRNQSSRWQTIASLSLDAFEQHIEATKAAEKELTSASMLRVAQEQAKTQSPPSTPPGLTLDEAVELLRDRVFALSEKWPKASISVMAHQLMELGQELLDNGELCP